MICVVGAAKVGSIYSRCSALRTLRMALPLEQLQQLLLLQLLLLVFLRALQRMEPVRCMHGIGRKVLLRTRTVRWLSREFEVALYKLEL